MKYWPLLAPLVLMGTTIETTNAGKTFYMQHCVSCHGVDGKGDGPAAAGLKTKPADLTKIAARRGGVWPALQVMDIQSGYSRVAQPRENMTVIVDILDHKLSEFDPGNSEPFIMPTKLIEIANYLKSRRNPAPKYSRPQNTVELVEFAEAIAVLWLV